MLTTLLSADDGHHRAPRVRRAPPTTRNKPNSRTRRVRSRTHEPPGPPAIAVPRRCRRMGNAALTLPPSPPRPGLAAVARPPLSQRLRRAEGPRSPAATRVPSGSSCGLRRARGTSSRDPLRLRRLTLTHAELSQRRRWDHLSRSVPCLHRSAMRLAWIRRRSRRGFRLLGETLPEIPRCAPREHELESRTHRLRRTREPTFWLAGPVGRRRYPTPAPRPSHAATSTATPRPAPWARSRPDPEEGQQRHESGIRAVAGSRS